MKIDEGRVSVELHYQWNPNTKKRTYRASLVLVRENMSKDWLLFGDSGDTPYDALFKLREKKIPDNWMQSYKDEVLKAYNLFWYRREA